MNPTLSVQHLPWDSQFFGFPIAQAIARTRDDVAAADAWSHEQQIHCMYLLVAGASFETAAAAGCHAYTLRGIRVKCTRSDADDPAATAPVSPRIRAATGNDVDRLEAIAATSHDGTRFYSDPGFSRQDCVRLYKTWIRRSCEGWADGVLVADEGTGATGYVTLHVRADGHCGDIGLLAVGVQARSAGVGLALVQAAVTWFHDRGVNRVTVTTQGDNPAALRTYQRAGFFISDVDLWFHKWFQRE
jgi:dTDP-4-amino-4,6-dideoxy-D-galactose acyltransferase